MSPSAPSSASAATSPHSSTILPMSTSAPIDVRRQLHLQRGRAREAQARRVDRRPDVLDEVLHALAGVTLLDAVLDGVAVARRAGTAERQEPDPQPLLEQALLHVVVPARPAQLDDDLLPEVLVARLLLHYLLDHAAIGDEGALFVFLELPEAAPVVEELGHRQLEPALGERDRLAGEPLAHARLDFLLRELTVHLGDRLVVLRFLLDVPDHELHPLLRHEA